MPTSPNSQAKLSKDPDFLARLSSLLLAEAGVVAVEDADTQFHAQRRMLAQNIINAPHTMAQNLAPAICNSTNLLVADTTYDFASDRTVTSADDQAIRSQIATLWNVFAGV
jgi:hypothetical protein